MPIQRRVLKGFLISRSPVSWIGDAAALHTDSIISFFKETFTLNSSMSLTQAWTKRTKRFLNIFSFFHMVISENLSFTQASCPVTSAVMQWATFKSNWDGITAFNTEKHLVARKHLNRFLTLSIHFVACCLDCCRVYHHPDNHKSNNE